MTSVQEAKRLKVGTRVKWDSSGELGRVTEYQDAGIRVRWDDGTEAIYMFNQMSSLSCISAVKA